MEVSAVSTGPQGIIIEAQQPDGKIIQVKVVGDEYNRTKYTLDGYTITQDALTKEYRYADEKATGEVYASDKVVGKDNPPAALKKGIVLPTQELSPAQTEYLEKRREEFKANAKSFTSIQNFSTLPNSIDGPQLAPPNAPTLGDQNGFCLLISFSDDPVTPEFAPGDVRTMFNGVTPIWGNAASIKQFFSEQSNGKMTVNTTVSSAYVRLLNSRDYYDNYGGLGAVQAVKDALSILLAQDPTYFNAIDLTTKTVDGRQVVKAFSVFYPGNPPPSSNNDLWPHSWVLNNDIDQEFVEIKAGVYVSNYQMSSLLFGTAQPVIGVACHEIGHMLCSFSDYYDYGNRNGDNVRSFGLGHHCLMADSANQQYPAQINPYLRMKAGWITVPSFPANAQLVTLTPTNFYQHAKSATEYFIFSNVQKAYGFWTQYLPAEGIAIWHIDETMLGNELQQMTAAQHYECSLEQADGMFHLENPAGNSGDANDLYYLGNPATGYQGEFLDDSVPNSRWWDGSFSDLFVGSFSAPGEIMTMSLIRPPPQIATRNPLPEGRVGSPYWFQFTTKDTYPSNSWSVVDAATLPAGLTLSPSGWLSGVPTEAKTNSFKIVVLGRSIFTTTNTFDLVVLPCYTAPYSEGFNGVMESALTGWHNEYVSNSIVWRTRIGSPSSYPSQVFEGDKNAYLGVYDESGSANLPEHITRYITPMIQFAPTAREVRLSFAYYLKSRLSVQDSLAVYYKTAWSNNWTGPITNYTENTAGWTQQSVTLPESAAGEGVYFAFEGSALGGHGISLDAIVIDDPVPPLQITTPTPLPIALCETNYTLAVPLVTLESVGGFKNAFGLTSYRYSVVNGTSLPSGFTLTSAGVIIGQWNTPIALTSFDVEVTDLIGGVKATNTLSFVVEYPRAALLAENFLADNGQLPAGWTQEYVVNTVKWKIGYPGGKDGRSPPSEAQSDSQYAFFYGTPGVGTEMLTKLVSPVFDLTQMPNNTRLVFWHFMQMWEGQDELRVYCRNVQDGPWTRLATYTSNVTSWTQRIIPLIATNLPAPTQYYQIAFEGKAKSGYGVCVDSVSITDDGGAPVILTRDVLPSGFDNFNYQTTLAAVGGVTPYRWNVVSNGLPRGLVLDSVTGIISGIPVGNTQAVFRVAVTGYDNKASTNTFSLTILPPGIVPYFEAFTNSNKTLPLDWQQEVEVNSTATWQILDGTYSDVTPEASRAPWHSYSAPYNACLWHKPVINQSFTASLITKPFDLAGCTNTILSFQLCMKKYTKQDWLRVYYRTHEAGEWKILAAYDADYFLNINAILFSSWTQQTFQLPEPTATYRLKFEGIARGGWGICIDDVDVRGEKLGSPLEILPPTLLPEGTNLVSYPPVTLVATNGTRLPYTWRKVVSDLLPPGLTLEANTGILSGTPTQAGLYTFGVTVQDANYLAATTNFTLRIRSSGMTPLQEWLATYFSASGSYLGDGADQSGDGIPNLIKYGMGLNPTNKNTGVYIRGVLTNLVGSASVANGYYPYLGYRRSLTATDVNFFVKGKTNLANVAELWLTNNIVELTPWIVGETDVWSWVYNVHTTPVTNAPQRFLRLEVERKP